MKNNDNPLISVIIPVYNMEKYLRRCLDSVLAQDYTNLEILVVDDGSTDGSWAICQEYARKDARITVIHQENGGLSAARNTGLDRATGAYIAFVDSDDYILPNMYSAMLACKNREDADIPVALWQYEKADGTQTVAREKIDPSIYGRHDAIAFERFMAGGGV